MNKNDILKKVWKIEKYLNLIYLIYNQSGYY